MLKPNSLPHRSACTCSVALTMKLLLLLLALELISLPCEARDFTFTVMVDAGVSDCFYDYIHEGAFLEIEYQV